MISNMNPFVAADFYKVAHIDQYHQDTKFIQSNMTPRNQQHYIHFADNDKRILVGGLQGFLKWFFIDLFEKNFFNLPKEEALKQIKRINKNAFNGVKINHEGIEAVWELGYLPLEVRALPEGSLSPIKVPVYSVTNTVSGFAWLVNYFESAMSSETWKTMTTATTCFQYKKLGKLWADKTCDNGNHLDFQFHMFAFRGEAGIADASQSEFGHLMNSKGTDTIPSIWYAEQYYDMEGKFVAGSVPASEHSVATTNIGYIIEDIKNKYPEATLDELRYKAEVIFLKKYIKEIYPTGIVSYVSDSYDFWKILTEASLELKEDILSRDGTLVFRPDSGVPEDVICGTLDYREVEDNTEVVTLEKAAEWFLETLEEQVRSETGHGEQGESQVSGVMKFESELYLVKVEFDWDRYDKQYYFIDGSRVVGVEKYKPTTEGKGAIEILWDIFGGHINSKGYKVLNPKVGLIYGDSITVKRAKEIFERLEAKGFASSNIVLGVGSFTTQYSTRDSLGFAVKATGAVIGDKEIMVTKEPKTDLGKKSAKGFLKVVKGLDGNFELVDNLSKAESEAENNELRLVFKDGILLIDEDLDQIRERVNSHLA